MLIDDTSRATPVPGAGGITPPKRPLWKWSLALTAVLLLVLMWQCGAGLIQGRRLANTAVRQFHRELNAGRYDKICREADEDFVKREELTKFLEAVHSKMGNVDSETLMNVRVNATTSGSSITTQFRTTFAQGPATETFTWEKSNGVLRLRGYSIQSSAFLPQQ
jgi:hypothetical protein